MRRASVLLAVVLSVPLQLRWSAAKPETRDVVVGYCEFCWWCIECWIVPVTEPYQPVTSWEHEQTFNPF
jgi:hypothetical protein